VVERPYKVILANQLRIGLSPTSLVADRGQDQCPTFEFANNGKIILPPPREWQKVSYVPFLSGMLPGGNPT